MLAKALHDHPALDACNLESLRMLTANIALCADSTLTGSQKAALSMKHLSHMNCEPMSYAVISIPAEKACSGLGASTKCYNMLRSAYI